MADWWRLAGLAAQGRLTALAEAVCEDLVDAAPGGSRRGQAEARWAMVLRAERGRASVVASRGDAPQAGRVVDDAAQGSLPSLQDAVSFPLVVDGRVWGSLTMSRSAERPGSTRLAQLVADTARSYDSAEALRTSSRHQALLLRLTAMVAGRTGLDELVAAAGRELLGDETVVDAAVVRADPEPAAAGDPVRERLVSRAVHARTVVRGAAAVAAPVFADGVVWGVVVAATDPARPLDEAVTPLVVAVAGVVGASAADDAARRELRADADAGALAAVVGRLLLAGADREKALSDVLDELTDLAGTAHGLVLRLGETGLVEIVASRGHAQATTPPGSRLREVAHDDLLGPGGPAPYRLGGAPARLLAAAGLPHVRAVGVRVHDRRWGVLVLASQTTPSTSVLRALPPVGALVGAYLDRPPLRR